MTAPENSLAVTMPQLGETVAEGTVLRWLKQVGDTVEDQEPLLEIATDKVDTEVPSPAAGVLLEIVVGEDTTVAVGTVLAHLGSEAATAGASSTGAGPAATGEPPRTPAPTGDSSAAADAAGAPQADAAGAAQADAAGAAHTRGAVAPERSGPRHRHSPRVRRLAREAGLDPDTLEGTGPSGRVTPDDVARAAGTDEDARAGAPEPTTAPSAAAAGPAGGAPTLDAATATATGTATATATAATAARSLRTVTAAVDVTALLRAANGVGGGAGPDAALAAVLTTRVVAALRAHPGMVASSGPPGGGLSLLVRSTSADASRDVLVERAEELNPDGILRRLVETPTGSPAPSGTGGACATLELSGEDHVLVDLGDPGPGQPVSIGVSRPTPQVVVVDQDGTPGIGVRHTAYVSVRFDQAVLDAAAVRSFLRDLVTRLASA